MKKTAFDLTHERKGTYRADGTLYPILCQRLLPGDIFKGNTEVFGRMIPLIGPTMQRFDLFIHYFAVPDRLIWDNFTKFRAPEWVGANDPHEPIYPSFKVRADGYEDQNAASIANLGVGSLADHFGLQFTPGMTIAADADSNVAFSSMPFRALRAIWNTHYRDIDLQPELPVAKTDGYVDDDENAQFDFLKRNWEKDYFTSARPFAQKGNPVSVMTHAPDPHVESQFGAVIKAAGGHGGTAGLVMTGDNLGDGPADVPDGPVNIETWAKFSIEELRWANAYQKFQEKLYRTGSRYKQFLKGFFDVKSSDARLDYPEFIGGGRQPFTIGEVLQTAQAPEVSPLGSYGGHGITTGNHSFKYRAEEDCQIIALMSIMPRVAYNTHINRQLVIRDVFDYVNPDFAGIGNQEIKNYELGGRFDYGQDFDGTWGYTDRYAQYKFIPSSVHGLFRTDEILKCYHAARLLDGGNSDPLDDTFIQNVGDDDTDRVFAFPVSGENATDPLLINIIHRITAIRPLPRKSIPGLY